MTTYICPICSSSKNRCSSKLYNQITHYFCKGKVSATPNGFKFLKTAVTSFDVYVESNDYYATNQRINAPVVPVFTPEATISVDARHIALSNIFKNQLSTTHTKSLISRGLNNEFISATGFTSLVNKRHYKNAKFAGFDNNGVYRGASGVAIPITNANKQFIGMQIGTDDASKGKYLWTTDTKQGQRLGYKDHYEMPVQVVGDASNGIYLCEGVLKPLVAQHIRGGLFIGASGGNFTYQVGNGYDLQEQVKDAIGDVKEVHIELDAGSLDNPNVTRLMFRLADCLVQNGIKPLFGDWGQWHNKDGKDIDEIGTTKVVYRDYEYLKQHLLLALEPLELASVQSVYDLVVNNTDSYIRTADLNNHVDELELDLESPELQSGVRYRFNSTDRANIIEALLRANPGKVILDSSETGSGKTYAVGKINPSACFVYPDGTEPGKVGLEFFTAEPDKVATDLPDFIRFSPRNESNCQRYHQAMLLSQMNSTIKVCDGCPALRECRTKEGMYIKDKATTLKSSKRFGNLLAIKNHKIKSKTTVIIDEAGENLKLLGSVQINKTTLTAMATFIAHAYTNPKISPMIEALLMLNAKLMQLIITDTQHGLSAVEIREYLKDVDLTEVNIDDIGAAIDELNDISISFKTKNNLNIGTILPNYIPLINALRSDSATGISSVANGNTLTIYFRHQDIVQDYINKADNLVLFDATLNPSDAAQLLNRDESDIIHIKAHDMGTDNLTITIITGIQKTGLNKSVAQIKACNTIVKSYSQVYGKDSVGLAKFKKEDLVDYDSVTLHGDARGSNKLEDKECLVITGIPIVNLNASVAEYEALTNHRLELNELPEEYIKQKTTISLIQTVGRVRANRSNITKEVVIIGDVDASGLALHGFNVRYKDCSEFGIKVRSKSSKIRNSLLTSAMTLVKNKTELTTTMLNKMTDVSTSTINRFYNAFGGKDKFTTILNHLISNELPSNPDEDLVYEAQTYIPAIIKEGISVAGLCQELLDRLEIFGTDFLKLCRSDVLDALVNATLFDKEDNALIQ